MGHIVGRGMKCSENCLEEQYVLNHVADASAKLYQNIYIIYIQ